jgi:hypothetical protein
MDVLLPGHFTQSDIDSVVRGMRCRVLRALVVGAKLDAVNASICDMVDPFSGPEVNHWGYRPDLVGPSRYPSGKWNRNICVASILKAVKEPPAILYAQFALEQRGRLRLNREILLCLHGRLPPDLIQRVAMEIHASP